MAEVRFKEIGDDVFPLVVEPLLGVPLAMGIIIAIDEMYIDSTRCKGITSSGCHLSQGHFFLITLQPSEICFGNE